MVESGTDLIKRLSINYLYHLTHITNLESILRQGLLSQNAVHKRNLAFQNISMPEVQDLREDLTVYGKLLHDYVSLYFWPRNAMLYKRRKQQRGIIVLGIDPIVLTWEATVFTDGNAASRNRTSYYKDVSKLKSLPWNVIRAHNWSEYPSGRRISCAEVLVYPELEPSYIRAIFCYSNEQKAACLSFAGPLGIAVEVNPKLYY